MSKTKTKKIRGVFERPPGNGIWWVQHFDATGHRRREKVGLKSEAIALAERRRSDKRKDIKLPENLRVRPVLFRELAKATLEYSKQEKVRSYSTDKVRMARLVQAFGDRQAENMLPEEIEKWLNATAVERDWKLATKNRYLALLKLTFRLAEKNKKVKVNPTRLLRMKKENNARIRYLNQYKPAPSELAYLKGCHDAESRIAPSSAPSIRTTCPSSSIALQLRTCEPRERVPSTVAGCQLRPRNPHRERKQERPHEAYSH